MTQVLVNCSDIFIKRRCGNRHIGYVYGELRTAACRTVKREHMVFKLKCFKIACLYSYGVIVYCEVLTFCKCIAVKGYTAYCTLLHSCCYRKVAIVRSVEAQLVACYRVDVILCRHICGVLHDKLSCAFGLCSLRTVNGILVIVGIKRTVNV